MSALAISLIAFLVTFGTGVIAAFLPGHRLHSGTKDVVRLGAGLISTIAGLVLGLLIASASGSFETQNNQIRQISAGVIMIDNLLAEYGAEAQKARSLLRESVPQFVAQLWKPGGDTAQQFRPSVAAEALYRELDRLEPKDDSQRSIKPRVTSAYGDIIHSRLLLLQRQLGGIPMPFVGVLVMWLALIFFSFGLFADSHYSVLVALFVVAVSTSAALFLILELTHPFDGLLRISSEPILNALAPLPK